MKRLIKWIIFLAVLGIGGWLASEPVASYLKERRKVAYRTSEVSRGKVAAVVNSTGTIKPVRSVQVGSFVSGPIDEIYVDFNDEVKKDQLLAKIDPKIYKAAAARDQAVLATRKAEVNRTKAQLQLARNDEKRAIALRNENKNFISDAEMDQYTFNRASLEAALGVAETSVTQAEAALETSVANLNYTEIRSPADGIVIDRKIDPGQTVAASFQTPELFVVAPDLKKEIRVFASVDETDIGLIRDAWKSGQPVRFTVDAYPDDLFEGSIYQIRMSSTTTQNVVTYPVVVSAPNPELKLLPGMTATISFQLREAKDVLRVPNASLRFFPLKEQVRPEDREIIENRAAEAEELNDQQTTRQPSAEEKAEKRKKRNRRHVWVQEGDFLRAIEIITGISDNTYTEVLSGDLKEGQSLVDGVKTGK